MKWLEKIKLKNSLPNKRLVLCLYYLSVDDIHKALDYYQQLTMKNESLKAIMEAFFNGDLKEGMDASLAQIRNPLIYRLFLRNVELRKK